VNTVSVRHIVDDVDAAIDFYTAETRVPSPDATE